MGAAMGFMIAGACFGLSGNVQQACEKSLEAGGKQSGIERNIDTAQQNIEKKANQEAYYLLGDDGVKVLGGGIFIAKTAIDKSLQFNAPTFGLCHRITNQVGINKYSTMFEWNF